MIATSEAGHEARHRHRPPGWAHRDDRGKRWRPRLRDGVCVAGLLIAVRRRLLGVNDEEPSSLKGARVRRHCKRATGIT